jgi:hypothetical protein
MNNIEFLSYIPTPLEKYLGIATVKLYGKVILRYKIVPIKDGSGHFPAPASYKAGDDYVHAFMLDSISETEELKKIIMHNVKLALQAKEPSVKTQAQQFGDLPF